VGPRALNKIQFIPASASYFAFDVTTADALELSKLLWRPHDGSPGVWWTRSAYLAAPLWAFVKQDDAETRAALGPFAWNYWASFSREPLVGIGVDKIRIPKGEKPNPFQVAGVQLGVLRKKMLLADQMGLGKTMQALCIANMVKPKRIIIGCPAAAEEHWAQQCERWLLDPQSITIATHPKKRLPDKGVIIVPFSRSHNFHEQILAGPPVDFAIGDEIHYSKSPTARRSVSWFGPKGIMRLATRAYALSGTPIPNQPLELHSLLDAMAPETMGRMSREDFQKEYCSTFRGVAKIPTKSGGVASVQFEKNKGQHQYALNAELRASGLMVRRTETEVGDQLPPAHIFLMHLTPTAGIADLVREEATLYEMLETRILTSQELIALQGHIARVRAQLGLLKAPKIAEYLVSLFEGGESHVVCFMLHLPAIEAIRAFFQRTRVHVRVLTGAQKPRERQLHVNAFQVSAGPELIIGQMFAAGEILTMTRSRYVVLGEIAWTPTVNDQAIARVKRMTQTRRVEAPIVTFPHAVEERVIRTNAEKSISSNQILDINLQTVFSSAAA
jgi:SWI/SNF-related matrix-associated actin-dependent regulator 1 of chromatin subfamily A